MTLQGQSGSGSSRAKVLVGDSVFEPATLTITDGRLHVEFDSPDLDNITIVLSDLPKP